MHDAKNIKCVGSGKHKAVRICLNLRVHHLKIICVYIHIMNTHIYVYMSYTHTHTRERKRKTETLLSMKLMITTDQKPTTDTHTQEKGIPTQH